MRSRAIVVMAVLSAALITGGGLVQSGIAGGPVPVQGARLFEQVMTRVAREYVDTVSVQGLYRKAVDGMLLQLHDPHTVYLSEERLNRLNESTSGNYGGLGIQMDVRDGWITIIAPLPGSPAERAGIQTADRIVEVNGRSTRGWTQDEATKALRGNPGSTVKLVVERPGVEKRIPFELSRRRIHARAVQRVAMLRPGVGYLDVNIFSDSTAGEVTQGVDSLVRSGARSLVLDLRGNPGGLLDQGVSVSDLFLDANQEIVSMRGRTEDANRTFTDKSPQRWPKLSLVVLVDGASASAAEIVAGALQDHDRAVLVGDLTYGKGSAQTVFPVAPSGALKLTTALWYTPVGRSINKRPRAGADDEDDATEPAADSVPRGERERFRTDGGRTVYGGGAITPDLTVRDTLTPAAALALQQTLGDQLPKFRDALTDFALSLKGSRSVTSPDFTVTPAMREELYRRTTQRGVTVPAAAFETHAAVVDRLLANEIARYVFGLDAEFLRSSRDDRVVAEALALLAGEPPRAELLRRATERQKQLDRAPARDSSTAR